MKTPKSIYGKPHAPCRRRSRRAKAPSYGDLCEMSGGLASVWRDRGCTEREMLAFIDDEPFILCDVVPLMHKLGLSEDDVLRHVPHDGVLARIALEFARVAAMGSVRRASALAVPPWALVSFLRKALTRRIAAMKNKATRRVHYEAEKVRRRAMAAERRRVARRTTTNPCPSREDILDAWRRVRDSKESLVRFGSLMQDLECYVDNSLRFDRLGRIAGRNAGVKGWLRENLPELAKRYTSVIRYKAAAKKLRQIVGLSDPTPVEVVLGTERKSPGKASDGGKGDQCSHCAEKSHVRGAKAREADGGGVEYAGTGETGGNATGDSPPVEVVRARAVYLESMEGVPDVVARVLARIDALCDPERTDEAAPLRSWREKYGNAITVRRKSAWWRRLTTLASPEPFLK